MSQHNILTFAFEFNLVKDPLVILEKIVKIFGEVYGYKESEQEELNAILMLMHRNCIKVSGGQPKEINSKYFQPQDFLELNHYQVLMPIADMSMTDTNSQKILDGFSDEFISAVFEACPDIGYGKYSNLIIFD